jgi:hypothetical protein
MVSGALALIVGPTLTAEAQGFVLGAFVAVVGSIIATFGAVEIARINIDADEARRHEEAKREAYTNFVLASDAFRDGVVAAIDRGGVKSSTVIADAGWADRFNRSFVLVDMLGSQDVSTSARAMADRLQRLDDLIRQTGGEIEPVEGIEVSKERGELILILSGLNALRHEFMSAARGDLGRPMIEFFEPGPRRMFTDSPTAEDMARANEQGPFFGAEWPPRLWNPLWRRLPGRLQAWYQRRFPHPDLVDEETPDLTGWELGEDGAYHPGPEVQEAARQEVEELLKNMRADSEPPAAPGPPSEGPAEQARTKREPTKRRRRGGGQRH